MKPMKGKKYVLLKASSAIGVYCFNNLSLGIAKYKKKKGVVDIQMDRFVCRTFIHGKPMEWQAVFEAFCNVVGCMFKDAEILDITDTIAQCLDTVLELEGHDNLKTAMSQLVVGYYL